MYVCIYVCMPVHPQLYRWSETSIDLSQKVNTELNTESLCTRNK